MGPSARRLNERKVQCGPLPVEAGKCQARERTRASRGLTIWAARCSVRPAASPSGPPRHHSAGLAPRPWQAGGLGRGPSGTKAALVLAL